MGTYAFLNKNHFLMYTNRFFFFIQDISELCIYILNNLHFTVFINHELEMSAQEELVKSLF